MVAVLMSDESPTGRVSGSWSVDGLPDALSVREIIRTRVREEVARHNLQDSPVFNGLVTPTEVEDRVNGYRSGRRRVDWEQQAEVALRAFESNGFFVLVDDRQVDTLDEIVDLRRAVKVSFVRLVPLVGG